MIQKLTIDDHENIMAFLKEEAALNLFIIGDIEVFGYDKVYQELWGDFDENQHLRAVLLRYYDSFIPYAKGEFDREGFSNIIMSYKNSFSFSGKSSLVEMFEPLLHERLGRKQETYFCECLKLEHGLRTDESVIIKEATVEDIDRILALRSTIKEFVQTANAKEMLLTSMEAKTARTYYVENENGEMIACASTTAENSLSAMIVGVCTHNNYRQKGLATLIMQKLVQDVLAEEKSLCLFYDNPSAGKIYKRIGFQDIGMWTMYR